MAFKNPFFSIKGQLERINNVGQTFKNIGKNIVTGNFTKSIRVAPEYKNTFIGKAASFITKPAVIITAPAVVAAAKVGAPAALKAFSSFKTSQAAAAVTASGSKALGFLGSQGLRKAAGTALLVGGGYAGVRTLSRVFEKGGAAGLISGTGTTQDDEQRTVITTTDPSGNPVTIETAGDAPPPGVTYTIDPVTGQSIPIVQGGGSVVDPFTGEIMPAIYQGSGNSSGFNSLTNGLSNKLNPFLLPAAILLGAVVLRK